MEKNFRTHPLHYLTEQQLIDLVNIVYMDKDYKDLRKYSVIEDIKYSNHIIDSISCKVYYYQEDEAYIQQSKPNLGLELYISSNAFVNDEKRKFHFSVELCLFRNYVYTFDTRSNTPEINYLHEKFAKFYAIAEKKYNKKNKHGKEF